MERTIILKHTVSGQELIMPVTPSRYPMASGRAVERIDMAQSGQIALPGLKTLMAENLEVMLPARQYPFCTADAVADPEYYLGLLKEWSNAGDVCRYIVTGTEINVPVLLGPVSYEERDGTNDVYAKILLYEYSYLDEVEVSVTQNARRPSEPGTVTAANTYTVAAGDSLWAISRKVYGDSSLALKLAAANDIANPNLIQVGQVLKVPSASALSSLRTSAAATSKPKESTGGATAAMRVTLGLG